MENVKIIETLEDTSLSIDAIVENCSKIIEHILLEKDAELKLTSCMESILVDNVGVSVSRKIISNSIRIIKSLPEDKSVELSKILLNSLKLRLMSFEDQVSELYYHTAQICEQKKEYVEAAQQLSFIPVENSQKFYSKDVKLDMFLRIAHLFLQGQDAPQAELYINRASLIINSSTDNRYQIKYKLCYARVLDYRKKFLEAAKRYAQLSLEPQLPPSERCNLIRHAIICAIIAPAGVHRSRLLAILNKDERSTSFPFYPMLKNMQSGHLISKEQVELFEKELADHQKAKLPNGMSILEAAVMEHNILAISTIYKSIQISSLSAHLEVTELQAEKVVGRMIAERRVSGYIDQIEQLVYFEKENTPWDEHINTICNKVNAVIDLLQNHEPEFTKLKMKEYRC